MTATTVTDRARYRDPALMRLLHVLALNFHAMVSGAWETRQALETVNAKYPNIAQLAPHNCARRIRTVNQRFDDHRPWPVLQRLAPMDFRRTGRYS